MTETNLREILVATARAYMGANTYNWQKQEIIDIYNKKPAQTQRLQSAVQRRLAAFSFATGGCYFCKQYTALSGMATVTKLGYKYYKIVLDASYANYNYIGYIMFSAQGTGDGVIVTKNEEIA